MGARVKITPENLTGHGGSKRAQLKPTDYRVTSFGEPIVEICLGRQRLTDIQTKAVVAYQDNLNVHVEAAIKDPEFRRLIRKFMKDFIEDKDVLKNCKTYLRERGWGDYTEDETTTFRLVS